MEDKYKGWTRYEVEEAKAFVSLGLTEDRGQVPKGFGLIYRLDGADMRSAKHYTAGAALINGAVWATVIDYGEGYGTKCRIVGTYPLPTPAPTPKTEPVKYTPDGNLSSDFEETF
uniref:Uncharacterized protein n=1 Tax=viral metagenome TaxID=1070528 RepID=A0A6H2A5T5_9ZZZZ